MHFAIFLIVILTESRKIGWDTLLEKIWNTPISLILQTAFWQVLESKHGYFETTKKDCMQLYA